MDEGSDNERGREKKLKFDGKKRTSRMRTRVNHRDKASMDREVKAVTSIREGTRARERE